MNVLSRSCEKRRTFWHVRSTKTIYTSASTRSLVRVFVVGIKKMQVCYRMRSLIRICAGRTCTSSHYLELTECIAEPGVHSVNLNVRGYSQTIANFPFFVTVFAGLQRVSASYFQAVFWHNQNGRLCEYFFVCLFVTKTWKCLLDWYYKIEGKAMIRNRYNYPTPPIRDIKGKHKHKITRP